MSQPPDMVAPMPSQHHEILIKMFRDRPTLAAELLRGPLHIEVPDFDDALLSSGDFTDVGPTEYRADAVITLRNGADTRLAIVIEVQLRVDGRKRRSWPAYVATLHARLDCPAVLLVVCPDQAVADWCRVPIRIGPPGSVLTPVAFGPRQVPVVTDLDLACRLPELAVLSAVAHGAGPNPVPVFQTTFAALELIDHEHANLYTDFIYFVLPAAARKSLEEFMTITNYRYQSEFARRYFNEGEAQGEARGEARGEAHGKAEALLIFLQGRGIEVSDEIRSKIIECTDLVRLEAWIRKAGTAQKIEDLAI